MFTINSASAFWVALALSMLSGCTLSAFDATGKICGEMSACPDPLVCARLAADETSRCRARCPEANSEGECFLGNDGKPARAFYVSPEGNDDQKGSLELPFKTIRKGLLAMTSGDILFLKGGTYSEVVDGNTFKMPGGFSWESPVVVSGMPGEVATLVPPSGCVGLRISAASAQYMVWENFVIDGSQLCPQDGNGIAIVSGVKWQRFSNIEVKDAPGAGLYANRYASQLEIRGSKFHGNGRTPICLTTNVQDCRPQVSLAADHVLLEGCELYDGPNEGVQIYSSTAPLEIDGNIIRNNTVRDTGDRRGSAAGISIAAGSNALVYNNVLLRNAQGIQVAYSTTHTRLLHNTFVDNQYFGIYLLSGKLTTVANNLFFRSRYYDEAPDGGTILQQNFDGDPQFVDAAHGDFHLSPTSPAVDIGMPLTEVTSDFDGVTRPQGPSSDMGAFELIR